MTPYEIKLLLDIYTLPNWDEGRSEPILPETLAKFEMLGLIVVQDDSLTSIKITGKCDAHISQLCNLPFPQELHQWIDHIGNAIPNLSAELLSNQKVVKYENSKAESN
jgi:hypothetical protein